MSYDPMSPNITEEKLDEIMAALPDKMEEAEISALTLTIHNAYLDEPAEIINNLIDDPAALAFDPMLVKRLSRMRAARQRARSARRLGIEVTGR